MIRAAGILHMLADGRVLFVRRSDGGDHGGEWCFPGGVIEAGESPEEAARREYEEEIGRKPPARLQAWTRRIQEPAPVANVPEGMPPVALGETVDFTTFFAQVGEAFTPKLNDEHSGYAWAPPDSHPQPLHPGCRIALDRVNMDELGVARAMAAGELTSPQRYMNVWLFDLRITGTGTAYRKKIDEHVYRPPENYLTPDFLARCNGLQVIFEHPKKSVLDSKEFADRAIGSILLPYIKRDEVWGIAKIYDEASAVLMESDQLSTSPAVVLKDGPDDNAKVKLEDGSTFLIEGKPALLDHLAICTVGVWDKGGDPVGVRSETVRGDDAMTDAERLAAEAATQKIISDTVAAQVAQQLQARADAEAEEKADADAGQKLDKLLSHLDSATKRFDRLDARMDSFEDFMKKDKKKGDADPEDPEKMAADKAKKDAKKDADEGDEKDKEKEKADAAKADAKKADGAKKDEGDDEKKAEEKKEEKADAAKADAALTPSLRERLDKIERALPARVTDEDLAKFADAQARADSVFQGFGKHAPRPLEGETVLGYRRRLAGLLKSHSKSWKDSDLTKVDEGSFNVIEGQVFADAASAANHPEDVPHGTLREVVRTNPTTGLRTITFVGPDTFIAHMKRPARQVIGINTRPHAQ